MLQAQGPGSTASCSKAELVAVPPDGVDGLWVIAEPLLALGASWSRKVSLEDVRERLGAGFGQLWLVFDPATSVVLCAFVSELVDYPSGYRAGRVVLLGGGSLERWRHFLPRIEQWAKQEGCRALEIVGRRGWKRVFPDYEHGETTIVKELA